MGFKYTSLEDGQVIETDEPREDLDELARWVRADILATPEAPGLAPSRTEPVAGPVNTAAVTGGDPPLLSATAGIADPADSLSTEEAAQRAAEQLQGDVVPPLSEQPPHVHNDVPPSAPAGQAGNLARPARNATTEEWAAYAKQEGIVVADDAGRDDIIAAYIDAKAPAGNASRDEWADWADAHDVASADLKRDEIRAAAIDAGWAKA